MIGPLLESLCVIDDLVNLDVLDRRSDAVQTGHLLAQLVGEERQRGLFGVPPVEVARPAGGFVEGEESEALDPACVKRGPRVVGDADHPSTIERILVWNVTLTANTGPPTARHRDRAAQT